jgi:hypothetical protein
MLLLRALQVLDHLARDLAKHDLVIDDDYAEVRPPGAAACGPFVVPDFGSMERLPGTSSGHRAMTLAGVAREVRM